MNRVYVRRTIVVLTSVAVLALGYVAASNMGFRISYSVLGTADSASGTNWISLPYRLKSGVDSAADLYADLGGAAAVASIARFDSATDSLVVYSGGPQNDFPLVPGEGLIVTMHNTVNYTITGSHDPRVVVSLLGPEDSKTGNNQYAPPYNAQATTAGQLIQELGGTSNVVSVGRWLRNTDTFSAYNGTSGTDFTLTRGEAYRVKMQRTVHIIPKVTN